MGHNISKGVGHNISKGVGHNISKGVGWGKSNLDQSHEGVTHV